MRFSRKVWCGSQCRELPRTLSSPWGYVTHLSIIYRVSRKDQGPEAITGFPDLQLELTSDISSTALSKIINFSCHHLFALFLLQHLAVLSCVSFHCSVLSTHFKSAVQITRP